MRQLLLVLAEEEQSDYWETNNPNQNDRDAESKGIVVLDALPALDAHVNCQPGGAVTEDVHTVVDGESDRGDGGQEKEDQNYY